MGEDKGERRRKGGGEKGEGRWKRWGGGGYRKEKLAEKLEREKVGAGKELPDLSGPGSQNIRKSNKKTASKSPPTGFP
jgi:hypothetical protein